MKHKHAWELGAESLCGQSEIYTEFSLHITAQSSKPFPFGSASLPSLSPFPSPPALFDLLSSSCPFPHCKPTPTLFYPTQGRKTPNAARPPGTACTSHTAFEQIDHAASPNYSSFGCCSSIQYWISAQELHLSACHKTLKQQQVLSVVEWLRLVFFVNFFSFFHGLLTVLQSVYMSCTHWVAVCSDCVGRWGELSFKAAHWTEKTALKGVFDKTWKRKIKSFSTQLELKSCHTQKWATGLHFCLFCLDFCLLYYI